MPLRHLHPGIANPLQMNLGFRTRGLAILPPLHMNPMLALRALAPGLLTDLGTLGNLKTPTSTAPDIPTTTTTSPRTSTIPPRMPNIATLTPLQMLILTTVIPLPTTDGVPLSGPPVSLTQTLHGAHTALPRNVLDLPLSPTRGDE
jgi:hypothetical protein